jgi:hypothetical protein
MILVTCLNILKSLWFLVKLSVYERKEVDLEALLGFVALRGISKGGGKLWRVGVAY